MQRRMAGVGGGQGEAGGIHGVNVAVTWNH